LTSKAVRDEYFVSWLYCQAKRDINNPPVDDDFFASITHSPENGRHVYGYIIDGKVEGIIEVNEFDGNNCYICWFFVNKKKHNLGIGQKLFNFVLDKFNDRTFELDVRASNKRAIHIYRKYGFSVVDTFERTLSGSRVKIYGMKRESVLLESVGLYFMDDLFCDGVEYLTEAGNNRNGSIMKRFQLRLDL
jgi:ribosomal protein S18 acetylase RimI-like enzyme